MNIPRYTISNLDALTSYGDDDAHQGIHTMMPRFARQRTDWPRLGRGRFLVAGASCAVAVGTGYLAQEPIGNLIITS